MNTETATGPLWCETFDADLLAVVPGAAAALGHAGDVELHTYCDPTNGRINCPSSWWTDEGLAAFFSTPDRDPRPSPHYWTASPLVRCTFLEVVRDEWVHGAIVVVNDQIVWQPPARHMERLMWDMRGWGTPLDDGERIDLHEDVMQSLEEAAELVARVLGDQDG